MPNKESAALIFLFPNPLFQIMPAEMPIKRKSVVHAGAKSQFGGTKSGFLISEYQVAIAGVVKKAPMIPAASQIKIAIIIFFSVYLFSNYFSLSVFEVQDGQPAPIFSEPEKRETLASFVY